MNKMLILLLAGALLVGGGTAAAQVLSDGVIHACSAADGTLRVTDPNPPSGRVCNNGETYVKWNQTGPKGATGPAGPTGPKGATGAQGPAGPSFVWAKYVAGPWETMSDLKTVASITLPKGGYFHISAKAHAYMKEMIGLEVYTDIKCRLTHVGPKGVESELDYILTDINDESPERAAIALEGLMWTETDGEKVRLDCGDNDGELGGWSYLNDSKLFAEMVGGYTVSAS